MNRVIYTNRFIQKDLQGKTIWPFLLLRPSEKDNKALLVHELTHLKQLDGFPWVLKAVWVSLRTLVSKKYAIRREAEAYRAQLEVLVAEGRYAREDLEKGLAVNLAAKYDYGLSLNEALEAIRNSPYVLPS